MTLLHCHCLARDFPASLAPRRIMCPVPINGMVKRMMGHFWPKQLGRGLPSQPLFPLALEGEPFKAWGRGGGVAAGGTLTKGKEPGSLNHCMQDAAPACYNSYWSYCAELLT